MDSVWARGIAVDPLPLNCRLWVFPESAQTVDVVSVPAAPLRPVHPPIPDPNVDVAFRPATTVATTANTALSTSICTDAAGVPIMFTRATAVAAPSGEVTDMELPVSAVPAVTSSAPEKTELISVSVSSYQTTWSSVSAHPAVEYRSAAQV